MSITEEAVVLSSLFGLLLFYILSVELSTFVLVVAAGTILVIFTNVMVPEAYGIDDLTGLVVTTGFLAAPALNIFL